MWFLGMYRIWKSEIRYIPSGFWDMQVERQTYRQAHHNTSHLFRGKGTNTSFNYCLTGIITENKHLKTNTKFIHLVQQQAGNILNLVLEPQGLNRSPSYCPINSVCQ